MRASRRQLRAGAHVQGAIPPRIAEFREEDWPPRPGEREGVTGDGAARFYARRRWQQAQRAFAAAAGMSLPELRAAIGGSTHVRS
jgi:hypothetical protein